MSKEVNPDIYIQLESILDKIELKDGKCKWEVIGPVARLMQDERDRWEREVERWNKRNQLLTLRSAKAVLILDGKL